VKTSKKLDQDVILPLNQSKNNKIRFPSISIPSQKERCEFKIDLPDRNSLKQLETKLPQNYKYFDKVKEGYKKNVTKLNYIGKT
jgi:hypothetical protein